MRRARIAEIGAACVLAWLVPAEKTTADDTAALQAALNAAAPGGTVTLEPGRTYLVNLAVGLKPKSNCRVRMYGATLRGTLTAGLGGRFFDLSAVSNVTLSGGTLLGSRAAGPAWAHGILAANVTDLSVEDMTFQDVFTDGLLLTGNPGSTRVSLRNCRFLNGRRSGVFVVSGREIAIENCAFLNTNGLAPAAGVQIQGAPGVSLEQIRITRSLFRGNQGAGLELLRGGASRLAHITLAENTIEQNLRGVALAQAAHVVLEGNRISGHATRPSAAVSLGAGSANLVVAGNVLENNYRGILADGASQVSITGNTLIGTGARTGLGAGLDGDGITCGASSAASVSQCVVTGNVISRSAGNGIRLLRGSYMIAADNVVSDSGQHGIALQGASDSQVRGNDVARSSLEAAGSHDDIQVGAGSRRNLVALNQCREGSAARSSIYVAAASADTLVAENSLTGGAGVSNHSATTSTNWDGSGANWNR